MTKHETQTGTLQDGFHSGRPAGESAAVCAPLKSAHKANNGRARRLKSWAGNAAKIAARKGRALIRDEAGALMPMIAGSTIALIGFVGLTVDGARLFYAKDLLQKSLDSAGLAAGNALNRDNMAGDAANFFNANFNTAGGIARSDDFTVAVSDDNRIITLSATADVDMTFMRLFGFDTVNLSAFTEITRETRGLELTLVMDNTGSMRQNGKIDAMKSAARGLVNTLYGEDEVNPNLFVALVPYVAVVNVGNNYPHWLTASGQQFLVGPTKKANDDGYYPTVWKGCMEARSGEDDRLDTPPDVAPFTPFFYADETDNDWIKSDGSYDIDERNEARGSATGPNIGCGPSITPLTGPKSVILDGINEMQPWSRGGTNTATGMTWGWRTISPRWRGLWQGVPAERPVDYDTPFVDKVAIILTDGVNTFSGSGPRGSDYTAYGREDDFIAATNPDVTQFAAQRINNRFEEICTNMKNEGIILYGITFGDLSSNTQGIYRRCASDPAFYFHAPTNEDLQVVFETIAAQLSNLRLSQ